MEDEFLSCPPMDSSVAGLCAETCSDDTECQSGQKCCSNGCGHSCARAEPIPYVPSPDTCPERDTLPGLCDVPSCEKTGCSDGLFCCPNPCGSMVCVEGVTEQMPCFVIQQKVGNSSLLGRYVPKCDPSTGKFQALQCHSHYCWCVDPASGKPQSALVNSTELGALECTG